MKKYKKRFIRSKPTRIYRKVFHLFAEGETEQVYFSMDKWKDLRNVYIKLHPSYKKTTARQIFQRSKNITHTNALKKGDEVWIVIDVDKNTKQDIRIIQEWCDKNLNYGLAISNPKFEYWLLLHFEEGNGLHSVNMLEARLKRFLPNYDKTVLDERKLILGMPQAIINAKHKYGQCNDWYNDKYTTVYLLVEKILDIEKNHV